MLTLPYASIEGCSRVVDWAIGFEFSCSSVACISNGNINSTGLFVKVVLLLLLTTQIFSLYGLPCLVQQPHNHISISSMGDCYNLKSLQHLSNLGCPLWLAHQMFIAFL